MAYRGAVRNPTSNNRSGFESQFSDLAWSANPPSSKRPRTNTGGKQNFNTAVKNKTPLKFDFRSTKTTSIIPAAGGPSVTSHPRYVSKPVLASQIAAQQNGQADGWNSQVDDWGEDGDDALLLAASQMVEPVSGAVGPSEEELLAMTAMLEDDDFGLEDVACLEAAAEEMEQEEERLNQTITVFNCPPTQATSPNVFRQPPPPTKGLVEVSKAKDEQERLKKLHLQAQGEASFLRAELGKQSKEIESERISKRKMEAEMKSKLESEKKIKENEISVVKTEKMFLVQEMQQLKEKLKQMETDMKKEGTSGGTPRNRKVLSQIKMESNDFPTEKEFKERKVQLTKSDVETQTRKGNRRKCRLKRSFHSGSVMVQTFAKVSMASSDMKSKVLQQTSKVDISREVSRMVSQLTAEINTALPAAPSSTQLSTLETLFSSCGSVLSTQDRTTVTETCSNLLSWIIRTTDCSVLSPTLSLLTVVWSTSLLDQDITAYILSLLLELIRTVKTLSKHISPLLINSIFSLLTLICKDPVQAFLLCKQSQDCFLSCIFLLLQTSLSKAQDVQLSACMGLVNWLLTCSAVSHSLSWVDNICILCTGDIVRALTLATQGQVRWMIDNKGHEQNKLLVNVLRDCVIAMARLQDNLRSDTGEETEWIKAVEAAASVQRKYIWTVQQLHKVDLGKVVDMKLGFLTMETEGGDKVEAMQM